MSKEVEQASCIGCLNPLKFELDQNAARRTPDSEKTYFDYPCQVGDSDDDNEIFMLVSKIKDIKYEETILEGVTKIVFDIDSIDHPVCDGCCKQVLRAMDNTIKVTEKDSDEYRAYFKILEGQSQNWDLEELEKELQGLQAIESELLDLISSTTEKDAAISKLARNKELEVHSLEQKCERYLKETAKLEERAFNIKEESRSMKNTLIYLGEEINKLKNVNVFKATFRVDTKESIGSINGFRLGSLVPENPPLLEINTALGQLALLLQSIANAMNFSFRSYYLVPNGSHSYIGVLPQQHSANQEALPLFRTRGKRYVNQKEFDSGMIAFLNCLGQLYTEIVLKYDRNFKLPYKIDIANNKIGTTWPGASYSVRSMFRSGKEWTSAMKFLIRNLEWCLSLVGNEVDLKEPLVSKN